MKKLYKARRGVKFDGVCAGLADYFGLDVTAVRLCWALLTLFTGGSGLLAYLVCMIVIPREPG
ncbi:MAG: PspC domain-containing protein [Clostridiales bacterium]|jgi:phage shock protein PspC (stress-responsive transcriptional regulator)|nr:PspC domain-containing protein [Clostridiales bacterium]